MPNNLEFRPCPHCQKSVRSNATRCHRCHTFLTPLAPTQADREIDKGPEPIGSEHGAAPYGGYDSKEDDFDYEEFLENEFGTPSQKWDWKRPVTWLVLFSLALPLITALIFLIRSF